MFQSCIFEGKLVSKKGASRPKVANVLLTYTLALICVSLKLSYFLLMSRSLTKASYIATKSPTQTKQYLAKASKIETECWFAVKKDANKRQLRAHQFNLLLTFKIPNPFSRNRKGQIVDSAEE